MKELNYVPKTTIRRTFFYFFFIAVMYVSLPQISSAQWVQKADFGGGGREYANYFTIGNIGYVGFGTSSSSSVNDLWAFDPVANTWTQKASIPEVGGREEMVSFSIGNMGYVGSGVSAGEGWNNEFWQYDATTDTWAQIASWPGLGTEAYGQFAFSINGKGYVGGGSYAFMSPQIEDVLFEYDPITNTWTQKANPPSGVVSTIDRVGFSIGNMGYVGCGRNGNVYQKDFWRYDPATDAWTQEASFPGIARVATLGFSSGSFGYIGLGVDNNSNLYNDVWQYNPTSNTWTAEPNFPNGDRSNAAGFAIGCNIYMGTGWGDNTLLGENNTLLSDFWEYEMPCLPCSTLTVSAVPSNACGGGATGDIVVSASGGTPLYTYTWSNGATTQNLIDITSGTYTVTVTDANGCTVATSTSISDVTPPTITALATNTCLQTANGSIITSVSDGTPGYTYTWSNGATTESINDLVTGTYTVTVTDANGCSGTASATVAGYPLPTVTAVGTSSCGSANIGTVTITVSGGTPGYTYSGFPAYTYVWSNGATTQNISNLPPGTYTVTVTDANGCTAAATAIVSDNSPVVTATATNTCGQQDNGSVTITVSNGTPGFTYTWSNGATNQNINNLPPGTYTVTVTDMNGCSGTASATVSDNSPVITATTTNTCGQADDGSINTTVSGGTPTYTYSWSNGATTQNISNLSPGNYTVTVFDANGCSGLVTAAILSNSGPAITATSVNACAMESSGTITVVVSGGTPSYTFSWSNGATTQIISSLVAGAYTVTVTDVNGCSVTTTVTITSNGPCPCDLLSVSFTAGAGPNPIQFTSTVNSGGAPITAYYWDFGDGTTSSAANPLHEFAFAGNHRVCLTVMILDSPNHCCDSSCQVICVTANGFSCDNYIPTFSVTPMGENTFGFSNTTYIPPGNLQPSSLWTFSDGGNMVATSVTHGFSGESGSPLVCLTLLDPVNGIQCSGQLCQSISLTGDMEALTAIQTTDFMMINPAPTSDYVEISYKNVCSSNARIVIYDGDGNELFSSSINPNLADIRIDIRQWAIGFYTAKLFVDNQLLEIKRFSKAF